jgi:hypothetical protein
MNCLNTNKETNIKPLKDIQELQLSSTTQPSTSQLIFSFQQLFKKLSTKIMPIDSKPNLSYKLLMDQLPCKESKFLKRKVFNFYLISYVTQVVLPSAILNG